MKAVVSSAAEVNLGLLYTNCRTVILARHTLTKTGQPDPPTLADSGFAKSEMLFVNDLES